MANVEAMSPEWDRWFDLQYDLCRDVTRRIDEAMLREPPAMRAALCAALIEHLAEWMRRDINLPEVDRGRPS